LKCKSSVPRLKRPVTMSIFRCRWQRRLDWRAGRKFSGNCWSGVNYAWCDLRFQPPAKIGRSQRSVKVGFDTLSWASHPSESGNSPLKSGLSLHLLAGHHEIIGLGFFFEPTVLADVPADAVCRREEIFAPLAPLTAFDTEEEAIQLANDTAHGLSAYAFTRDIGRVFRLAEHLEAGMIGINDGLPTTSNAPFGGVKQSGWGRELGSEGLGAFLET